MTQRDLNKVIIISTMYLTYNLYNGHANMCQLVATKFLNLKIPQITFSIFLQIN